MPYNRRGFVQSSSDWTSDVSVLKNIVEPVYGEENVAAYPSSSSGYTYMRERGIGMEVAFYYAHSSSWFHQNDRGPFGTINTTDLISKNGPGALLTFGFNCHGADYLETPTGCLGQHYVFEGKGLTFVGNTISTGNNQISMAKKLVAGDYLGNSFFKTLNEDYKNAVQSSGSSVRDHEMWGNIILGTPFIWVNESHDMAHSGAHVSGEITNGEDVILTIFKDNNIYTIFKTEEGIIDITGLDIGNYMVEIETLKGALLDQKEIIVSNVGQSITDWNIEIPLSGHTDPNTYYMKLANNNDLPDDWRDDGVDLSLWNQSLAQFIGSFTQDYHFLETESVNSPSGNVFIRKQFTIYNLVPDSRVYIYSANSNPAIYVNGDRVFKNQDALERNFLSPFISCFDITDKLIEGGNFVNAYANSYIHTTAPVYEMESEPIVSIPESPSDLVSNKIDESIVKFLWTDNSDNEDGFILERREGNGDFEIVSYIGKDKQYLTHAIGENQEDYEYRLCAYNYAGISSYSNETITDIREMLVYDNLKLYPNPVSNMLTIENIEPNTTIDISNIIGQRIYFEHAENNSTKLNLSSLKKGIYFISFRNAKGHKMTKRIVKCD